MHGETEIPQKMEVTPESIRTGKYTGESRYRNQYWCFQFIDYSLFLVISS